MIVTISSNNHIAQPGANMTSSMSRSQLNYLGFFPYAPLLLSTMISVTISLVLTRKAD